MFLTQYISPFKLLHQSLESLLSDDSSEYDLDHFQGEATEPVTEMANTIITSINSKQVKFIVVGDTLSRLKLQ